jgi:hypothetical protein
LARRVLTSARCGSLWVVLALASCQRDEHAPAPSASVSGAAGDFAARARERHFEEELERARARWQQQPNLADCSTALKDKSDLELCHAAENALAQVTSVAAPTPEAALARLAPAALALVQLSERLRYLSLQELTERRVTGDAGVAKAAADAGVAKTPTDTGVAKAPTSSAAVSGGSNAAGHPHEPRPRAHAEQRAVQLSEGPASRALEVALRLERDVIRNLGAYLEYGPLAVRRAAFATSKDLRAQHPRWPALARLLNEASVLESDLALKGELRELAANGALQRPRAADQSAETK